MVCLDTNIIIDYIKGKQDIVQFVNKCLREGSVRTTAITQYELGLYGDGKPTPAKALANLIETYPLSSEAADKASQIFHILKRNGRLINEFDIMIAGIALVNDDILVTDDKEFLALESDKIIVI